MDNEIIKTGYKFVNTIPGKPGLYTSMFHHQYSANYFYKLNVWINQFENELHPFCLFSELSYALSFRNSHHPSISYTKLFLCNYVPVTKNSLLKNSKNELFRRFLNSYNEGTVLAQKVILIKKI